MAIVSSLASFVVCLGTNGRVTSQGSLSEVMQKSEEAEKEMKESEEELRKAEEVEEVEDGKHKPAETASKSDGKLVVAEEIALGHVSWAAG